MIRLRKETLMWVSCQLNTFLADNVIRALNAHEQTPDYRRAFAICTSSLMSFVGTLENTLFDSNHREGLFSPIRSAHRTGQLLLSRGLLLNNPHLHAFGVKVVLALLVATNYCLITFQTLLANWAQILCIDLWLLFL